MNVTEKERQSASGPSNFRKHFLILSSPYAGQVVVVSTLDRYNKVEDAPAAKCLIVSNFFVVVMVTNVKTLAQEISVKITLKDRGFKIVGKNFAFSPDVVTNNNKCEINCVEESQR